jgi:hypothetical protein
VEADTEAPKSARGGEPAGKGGGQEPWYMSHLSIANEKAEGLWLLFSVEPYIAMPVFTLMIIIAAVGVLVSGGNPTTAIATLGILAGLYVLLGVPVWMRE